MKRVLEVLGWLAAVALLAFASHAVFAAPRPAGVGGRPARSRRVGVFAKARPGVMFIGELTSGFNCSGGASARTRSVNHNNLALDAGGVLELYPSSRAVARFDAGDTIVRVRNANGGGILFAPTLTAGGTTHSFQFGVGFGYRF